MTENSARLQRSLDTLGFGIRIAEGRLHRWESPRAECRDFLGGSLDVARVLTVEVVEPLGVDGVRGLVRWPILGTGVVPHAKTGDKADHNGSNDASHRAHGGVV